MRPLFVYGTLRSGEAGIAEIGLAGRVTSLGPARVAGQLYDLGDYPGATLGGDSVIVGELLQPCDETMLATMDTYELFDPANPAGSEYLRVTATTLDSSLSIWIYVYNFPLEGARLVPGGDWLARDRS